MSNRSDYAYPVVSTELYCDNDSAKYYPSISSEGGLTKREMFAAMAMQGLLASVDDGKWEVFAKGAVECADALIAELNKETP